MWNKVPVSCSLAGVGNNAVWNVTVGCINVGVMGGRDGLSGNGFQIILW